MRALELEKERESDEMSQDGLRQRKEWSVGCLTNSKVCLSYCWQIWPSKTICDSRNLGPQLRTIRPIKIQWDFNTRWGQLRRTCRFCQFQIKFGSVVKDCSTLGLLYTVFQNPFSILTNRHSLTYTDRWTESPIIIVSDFSAKLQLWQTVLDTRTHTYAHPWAL